MEQRFWEQGARIFGIRINNLELRLPGGSYGLYPEVVISNEVQGEIFYNLQLKPCVAQKISPHAFTLSVVVRRNDIEGTKFNKMWVYIIL